MDKVFEKIIEKLEELKKSETEREDLCDEEGHGDGEEIYEDGKSQGRFEQVVRIIEIVKQEAEKYNNGWIPCSEQLPENISTVILQVKEIEKPTFGWYGNITGWKLTEEDFLKLKDFTVVAWKPLPKPFQKGE